MQKKLLLHYPFISNSLDYSGNDIHGTLHGPTLQNDRFGDLGSYSFDGIDDYIEIENPHILSLSNESFSISLWAKIEDNDNTYKTLFVISNKNLMPRIELMKARSGYYNGGFYFQIAQSEDSRSTAFSLDNGSIIAKNVWMHIVGVVDYKKKELSLFMNSKLQETVPLISNFNMPNNINLMARVGKSTSETIGENQQRHRGSLDDIRVYSLALNQKQIDLIYKDEGINDK